MINLLCDFGQRGNRLFLMGHVIACAIEWKQNVKIWTSWDYSSEYKCTIDGIDVEIIKPSKIRKNIAKLWNKFGFQNDNEILNKIKQGKDVWITNWSFRNEVMFIKHRQAIINYFTPHDSKVASAKDMIRELKKENDILIGVHIRRGDYKFWANGEYFFSFEAYKNWMNQTYRALQSHGNCGFVVFSNEKVPDTIYDSNYNVVVSEFDAISDQYMMSQCDYIISTRTTFASWAEFMGGAKRVRILKEDTELVEDSFQFSFKSS